MRSRMERGCPHPRGEGLKDRIARMWASALLPLGYLERTLEASPRYGAGLTFDQRKPASTDTFECLCRLERRKLAPLIKLV